MNKRVLIVEDDVLLAMDLADQLTENDLDVLGPCLNCADALSILETEGCDGAVLDIDLGSETSEAVAHSLISSDIPFAVVSGNLNAHMPAVFFGVPSFSKPVQLEGLLSFLKTTPQT